MKLTNTKLSTVTSILIHEISHLLLLRISEHSIQWNSFGITETSDDGRLRPKYVVKRRSVENSCIVDWIIIIMYKTKQAK
jgi:hypothetical protein